MGHEQGRGRNAVWRDRRVVALLMAASLTTMANATIGRALPGMQRLFGDDPNSVLLTRLLVPAPSLSVASVAPFAGLLVDRLGRRRLLLAGVVLFALAGCAGLVLPSLSAIFTSRLGLRIAVALIMLEWSQADGPLPGVRLRVVDRLDRAESGPSALCEPLW